MRPLSNGVIAPKRTELAPREKMILEEFDQNEPAEEIRKKACAKICWKRPDEVVGIMKNRRSRDPKQKSETIEETKSFRVKFPGLNAQSSDDE